MAKRSRSTSRASSLDQSRSSPSQSTSPHGRSKIHLPDTASLSVEVMRCSLPPHKGVISFASYEDYEVHYLQEHVNRCAECRKNFPTRHFLELHIEENHDPLVATRRDRGEKTVCTYIYIVRHRIWLCISHASGHFIYGLSVFLTVQLFY